MGGIPFQMSLFHIRVFSVCVAFALIFSFGLHTVDTNHTHPTHVHEHGHSHSGTHGESTYTISEYAHMAEKKWLSALIVGMLFASLVPLTSWFSWRIFLLQVTSRYVHRTKWLLQVERIVENTLTRLFSRGILHPRPY